MLAEIFRKCSGMKKFFFFIFTAIFICGFISSGECREVVFVINSSQSMQASDPFNEVAESVTFGIENLYDDDEAGIVAFNDNATIIHHLTKVSDAPDKLIYLRYSGGSNAGAGLLTAIDMLMPKFNTQRDIIFITNGSIKDAQSEKNFQAGLEQAKWLGISVYFVELRHNSNPQNYKLYEGYVKAFPVNYYELLTTIRTILQGDFYTPHIEFSTNNLTHGKIHFKVPVENAQKFKIFMLSSNVGNAALKNYSPAMKGHFVKIFEIHAPNTNAFEFEVDYPQGTGLTLDVIPTVSGTLQTNTATKLLVKDILEITPMNDGKKILADNFFEGQLINLQIDSKKIEGKIHNGTIQVPLDDLGENISLQKIHFEDVGLVFDGDDTAQIYAPKSHYAEALIALIGLAILGGLLWRIRNKNKSEKSKDILKMFGVKERNIPPLEDSPLPKTVQSDFSYSGKLMIYVTRVPDNEEIAPREFNLFRMNSAQIPLAYVLKQCNINENFQGASKIFINPDKNCISVENKSDCTITKRNILVEKGGHVELYYNDSVNVATNDESAEMILLYKSLKPV